jgi:rhodanese-related sulfurtransferase
MESAAMRSRGDGKALRSWDRRGALRGLVVLAAIGLAAVSLSGAEDADSLSAPEALAQTRAGKIVLIDVRSPAEWRETGVPEGAKTVPIHHPQGARGFLRDILKAVGGDKSRPVALICARGVRSSRGKRFLEANGFSHVRDVPEGMLGRGGRPGWLARKLPTRPCPLC